MQCNVTWQTSSEYRRLTVPSGRILNYVSFVRKIQIPEIFGSPLVCIVISAVFHQQVTTEGEMKGLGEKT
jgi:hypothetical protein